MPDQPVLSFRPRRRTLASIAGEDTLSTNVRGEPSLDDYRLIAEGGYDWESWINPDESLRWTNKAGSAISGYSARECREMQRFPWPLVAKDDHHLRTVRSFRW
jgi:hypothetical protein